MEPNLSQQAAMPSGERRAAARRRYLEGPLLCFLVLGSAHHRSATLRDVSISGVGLLVGSPLEPGTALFLQVPGEEEESIRFLRARVVRAARREDGSWLVGCQFASTLSREELARAFPETAVPT
jgi:hypothetical protein